MSLEIDHSEYGRSHTIRANIIFLVASHGESKTSLSKKMQLTRTTINNILKGNTKNVQRATIAKLSNFYGIPHNLIENIDLKSVHEREQAASLLGDKNPVALPVIPLSDIERTRSKSIGILMQEYELTYHYVSDNNLIALLIDVPAESPFTIGNKIIMSRSVFNSDAKPVIAFNNRQRLSLIRNKNYNFGRLHADGRYIGYFIGKA